MIYTNRALQLALLRLRFAFELYKPPMATHVLIDLFVFRLDLLAFAPFLCSWSHAFLRSNPIGMMASNKLNGLTSRMTRQCPKSWTWHPDQLSLSPIFFLVDVGQLIFIAILRPGQIE